MKAQRGWVASREWKNYDSAQSFLYWIQSSFYFIQAIPSWWKLNRLWYGGAQNCDCQKHTLCLFLFKRWLPSASQYNYLCICNSFSVSLCKKKSTQNPTLGILVFLVSAQGLGASGHSTHAHWINTEQSGAGLYPAWCNSVLHQHCVSLLFCVSHSSSYKNKFLHLPIPNMLDVVH